MNFINEIYVYTNAGKISIEKINIEKEKIERNT